MSKNQILLIFISIINITIQISILSKSQIEKCPSSSTCKNKIILQLTIQNAELESTDSISTTLTEISQSENSSIKKLQNPIKITISKSKVKVIYPTIYFQDFNYYPKETIIKTDYLSCEDNINTNKTTCPLITNDKKERIIYSEGFCCNCPPISFLSSSTKRFGDCKKLNIINGISAAHCLTFDNLFYSAYQIKNYQIEYEIKINIENTTNNELLYSLILSPNNQNIISNDGKISIKIIGDFLPSNNLPNDLSSYYLLIPSYPKDNIKVIEGKINWMILEREKFSLDGRECDKIGVSYYAFKTQGNRCEVEQGSCLNNQIYHFYNEDINNIQKGKKSKYLLFYDKEKNYSFYNDNDLGKKFGFVLNGNINTMLSLEIDSDDIKFIVNVSKGKIIFWEINNFEAMSNNGILLLKIKNIGLEDSQFYISYFCNDNIINMSSDEISIKSNDFIEIKKNVFVINDFEMENSCNVTLKNSIFEIDDFVIIEFNTTERITNIVQGNDKNNSGDNVIVVNDDGNKNNCNLCDDLFSFRCFLRNYCWLFLLRATFIIIFSIFFIFIFIKILICFSSNKCCFTTNKIKQINEKPI